MTGHTLSCRRWKLVARFAFFRVRAILLPAEEATITAWHQMQEIAVRRLPFCPFCPPFYSSFNATSCACRSCASKWTICRLHVLFNRRTMQPGQRQTGPFSMGEMVASFHVRSADDSSGRSFCWRAVGLSVMIRRSLGANGRERRRKEVNCDESELLF